MRIVVFPRVLRPPSDTALLGGVTARRAVACARLNARLNGLAHEGRLGPVAHERLDYLRSLEVADHSLAERMVVVEGRVPAADLEPVA